jgi:very-short-patch-repair endonuclease
MADPVTRDLALLEMLQSLAEAASKAGVERSTAAALSMFAQRVISLCELDDETLSLRVEGFVADGAEARLARGKTEAQSLCDREALLAAKMDLASAATAGPDKLFGAANTILQANAFSPLFSSKHRNAIRLGRSLINAAKAKPQEIAALLNTAAAYLRDSAEFSGDAYYRDLFGGQWRGHHSNFAGAEDLARRLGAAHLAFLKAQIQPALSWLISASTPAIRTTADVGESLSEALARFAAIGHGAPLPDTLQRLRQTLEQIGTAIGGIRRCGIFPDAELGGHEPPISKLVRSFHELCAELEAAAIQYPWFSGVDEDADLLRNTLDLAITVFETQPPEDVVSALRTTSGVIDLLARLRSAGRAIETALAATQSAWSIFETAQQLRPERFFAGKMREVELSQLKARTEEAVADERGLRLYADLLKCLAAASKFDLDWIYEAFISRSAELGSLADTYELALIRTLLQQALRTDGAGLAELAGAQLADASDRFISADKILEGLEAARIIAGRLEDDIPQGRGSGPKSGWTDEHLIHNEISKVRKHIPMRDLVTRAHGALQALKPVWLMSPTSVAQFVPPGTASFDLVIIDEASQMTPEMAVGALARGRQIVIVGDPKQLPPSNWFKITPNVHDDDDDDGEFDIETESILDLAFSRLNDRRRLKWHYRSQHASLIQFSNRQFYDKELVIFPSPIIDDELLGVKSRFVGGAYEARINETEAREVIEALVGLIYTRPELSFGVVTMNADQRELIFQEFERIKQENKTVREYADRLESSVDELFIKNLENVQGDERDIILISTLYGPPPGGGRVLQRFGIFTRKDGHRRLNVLVTRARMATILFTSLRPADVVITENSSEGVQAFKAYLSYAEGAPTAESEAGGEPDSDFEVFVADRIESHGYQVVPQVGVEGFRIDLGIKHPAYPSGFLAGVECDGASYHSHLCVRDRDRIRQEVLERLGWNIYRVWSTDWFNDPARETAKLIAWLDELRDRYEAKFERANLAAEAFKAAALPITPEPEVEVEPEPPAAEPPAPAPTLVLRAPPGPKAPVNQGELFSSSASAPERPQTLEEPAHPTRGPTGKRHVIDGIEFYESMTGFYEVWIGGEEAGTVERLQTGGAAPARVYGGAFHAKKPSFLATRAWNEATFVTDDIYAAVRRLAREFAEHAGHELA